MQTTQITQDARQPYYIGGAAALAQLALLRLAYPSLGNAIAVFHAVACFFCVIHGMINVSRLGRRSMIAYFAGYVALFLFFMVFLGGDQPRAIIFGVFALTYAAVFHHGALLGYFVIVLIAFFVFPFHALSVLVMLSLSYALFIPVHKAARKADNHAITVFFIISLVLLFIVFFPLMHFAVQRTPQDLTRTLFGEQISPMVRSSLYLSFITSTISTVIVLLLGLPLAYVMARADFKGKSFLDIAIDIPILLPGPILGLALIMLVGGNTDIGMALRQFMERVAARFGAARPTGNFFEAAAPGIILAQVIVSMPFMVRSVMSAFNSIDPRLEYVSRTLGAGPFRTIFGLTLPLASRGIFVGCVLAWARAISEFASVYLIAQTPYTGPTYIYWLYERHGATGPSANVAIIMVLMCVTLFAALHLLGARMIWKRSV